MATKQIFGAILASLMAVFAADWPQFGGVARNFTSPETGVNKDWAAKPPKLAWKLNMHDDGYAGPAVARGVLYIVDRDGENDVVLALDAKSGKEIWRFAYADAGKPNYGYCRSTPAYDNGKVYTLSRLGLLHCLDAKTGKPAWSVNILQKFGGRQPQWLQSLSPLIDGNRVIVCPGGSANPVALDKETGNVLWQGTVGEQGKLSAVSYATPVIAEINGKKQYLLFMAKGIYGADAADGKQVWSAPWETAYDINGAMPIALDGNKVFIASSYNHGCALLKISGAEAEFVYSNRNAKSRFSTPILHKGFLYANNEPDLACLAPATGELKWSAKGLLEFGGFCLVDDALIAMNGKSGDLILVKADPAGYSELGRLAAPLAANGQCWTAPIVAEKKLIARTKLELGVFDLD
ncbi:MAG: PQQ-like beta-propeller repeat protein [Spirochaetes bacterium]|nr:PQQ-like beta-propeller repeat protein [Spirochaetota bacterium]